MTLPRKRNGRRDTRFWKNWRGTNRLCWRRWNILLLGIMQFLYCMTRVLRSSIQGWKESHSSLVGWEMRETCCRRSSPFLSGSRGTFSHFHSALIDSYRFFISSSEEDNPTKEYFSLSTTFTDVQSRETSQPGCYLTICQGCPTRNSTKPWWFWILFSSSTCQQWCHYMCLSN